LEPNGHKPPFFDQIPPPFQARAGEWLLVPIYHIFGSEELSRFAQGIAQLSPEPYLALNAEDAERFGTEVELFGQQISLTRNAGLPRGLAGVPVGIPPFAGLDLPMWSRISRLS
jgi:NADH-quinone oxidoreductase subunit G